MTMHILEITNSRKEEWNSFVEEHFPPIGGFMATWEWGEFQMALGRRTQRYFVMEGKKTVALFTLVFYPLRLGYSYGYMPRGPMIAQDRGTDQVIVLETVRDWLVSTFPKLIFCRMEPPIKSWPTGLDASRFHAPTYYVQPRYNLAISLTPDEVDIQAQFHSSVRSNISRATRRGATVVIKDTLTDAEREEFYDMMRDTVKRNSGKNVYPNRLYYGGLFKIPSIKIFCGYQDGKLAACHVVICFGKTATYLYGAAYSWALNSKVTTLLHWEAMHEFKKLGYEWYDIGGIDMGRWPSLTEFKRRFKGAEFSYVGNIDVAARPLLYRLYNILRKIRALCSGRA